MSVRSTASSFDDFFRPAEGPGPHQRERAVRNGFLKVRFAPAAIGFVADLIDPESLSLMASDGMKVLIA
jgi:hypothetical protein